jgi:N-acetylneuraminate synthase
MIIENKKIALNKPTYFIADIAANHDGDISRAKDLIYQAAEAGADAAKFQHFNAKTIVSKEGFEKFQDQKSHQSKWKKSVFEVYRNAEVNLSWTPILKETCKKAGISFFTSPYSIELVDEVDPFVPAYKIGSGDITWIEIIKHIASKNKPYILATGASTIEDVSRAVNAALNVNENLALLQCNTNYTASLENFKFIQLNVLKKYAELFPNLILGLSDHTPGHSTVLGAVTLGARIIEKHFTDDNNRIGPDHLFSMNPKSWTEMVLRTRELENSLGNGVKKVENNEKETVVIQRRSLWLNKSLVKGDIIKKDDIDILRPSPQDGIQPYNLNEIIGKKLTKNKNKGENIKSIDFE